MQPIDVLNDTLRSTQDDWTGEQVARLINTGIGEMTLRFATKASDAANARDTLLAQIAQFASAGMNSTRLGQLSVLIRRAEDQEARFQQASKTVREFQRTFDLVARSV